jgi:hypothetical protein
MELLVKSLESSSLAIAARADVDSALLRASMEGATWWPRFSFDSPGLASFNRTGAENVIVVGAPFKDDNQNLFALTAAGSVEQRLPGAGLARLGATQETEYAAGYNAWRQSPSLDLSVSQPLGPGAFGFGVDPNRQAAFADVEKAALTFLKSKNEILLGSLHIMRAFEAGSLALDYATAVKAGAELRLSLAKKRAEQGDLTRADLWKAEAERADAGRSLDKAAFEYALARDDWTSAFGSHPPPLVDADRDALLALLARGRGRGRGDSIEARILENERESLAFQRVGERLKEAPVLSVGLSVAPDANRHYFAKDFFGSWESLTKSPVPYNLSLNLGLKYALPGIDSRVSEDGLSTLALRKKEAAIADFQMKNDGEIARLARRVSELEKYRSALDEEFARDESLSRDRDELLGRGELSPIDVMDSKASSLQFRGRRADAIWELIVDKAQLLADSGQDLARLLTKPGL